MKAATKAKLYGLGYRAALTVGILGIVGITSTPAHSWWCLFACTMAVGGLMLAFEWHWKHIDYREFEQGDEWD